LMDYQVKQLHQPHLLTNKSLVDEG
jgi:hypothetical protein